MAPTHPDEALINEITNCFLNEVLPLQPNILQTTTLLELQQLLYAAIDAGTKEILINDFFHHLFPGFSPIWRTSPQQQEVHIYGDSNMEESPEIQNIFDCKCISPKLLAVLVLKIKALKCDLHNHSHQYVASQISHMPVLT